MGIEKELMSKNYKLKAVGNIRDCSLKELWEKFRETTSKELIQDYFNKKGIL